MIALRASIALAIILAFQTAPQRLGERLKSGMLLSYSSDGVDTHWLVVAVNSDTTIGGRHGCTALRLRLNPKDSATTQRLHCSDSSSMLTWAPSTGVLQPARPLTPGTLVVNRPDGGRIVYVAKAREIDSIGGVSYVVVPTTVETFDAGGRLIRRLRERFSIELATATHGVFEVPEGSGFRTERTFVLTAITPPGR